MLDRATGPWPLALVAFGLSGLFIAAVGLAAVVAWDGGPGSAATDPVVGLRRTLATSRAAVLDAAESARSADAGLESAADAAGSAGGLTADLAITLRTLASVLRTPLVGVEPLAPAAPAFETVADRAAALAADLAMVRTAVGTGAEDVRVVGDRLVEVALQLADLDGAVDGTAARISDVVAGLRLLAVALLGWFGVLAGGAIWLGLRLRSAVAR